MPLYFQILYVATNITSSPLPLLYSFFFTVTALGRRVYFAVELEQVMSGQNTAPITSGHKRMYQARTFINSTEGNVPPCFLFLQVNQTYPEYLITFS